jgi:hypothetical protein
VQDKVFGMNIETPVAKDAKINLILNLKNA